MWCLLRFEKIGEVSSNSQQTHCICKNVGFASHEKAFGQVHVCILMRSEQRKCGKQSISKESLEFLTHLSLFLRKVSNGHLDFFNKVDSSKVLGFPFAK